MHSNLRYLLVFCIALCAQSAFGQKGFPKFSEAEQQWMSAHPIVKFSIHEKYRPYWDSGIYPKLLSKLKDCSGLEFHASWRNSDEIGIHQIRNGEVNFVIDPNQELKSAVSGYLSDPIFWGHDVIMTPQSKDAQSLDEKHDRTIYFDRGYDFIEKAGRIRQLNSPQLMIEQLLSGEAHLAVLPLRLAIHLSNQFDLKQFQIKPLGHHPFAYQWLIAEKDQVLNSIVQKSLREADPIFLGNLLAIPALPSKSSTHLSDWLWITLFGSSALITLILTHYIWQRKKQSRKEENLLNMAQEAKDASEAKSAFLATVSHEIRTPMNAVIGAQELLLKNSSLNHKQRELLQSAQTSAASLLGMLNQVLDMAKIEAGKFTIEHEPVDLKQILSEINQTFSIYAQNKGLKLSGFIDPNIADVLLLDPMRIRQILHNLLSNAIKFTDHGFVFFEVRILANDHAGQLLEFRVIDQGIGMAKEDIERVQMPFEQVRNHLSCNNGPSSSTGLGLSITNHLIGLMESKLIIESALNLGTNIHFVIAFSRTCYLIEDNKQKPNDSSHPSFKGIRALVVEDHPASRQILVLQLKTLGMYVDQCANGYEALERLNDHAFDIVLTDHSMPGIHGTDLARKIRSLGFSKTVIVGITADIYAKSAQDNVIQSGMDAIFIKPIRLESLEIELLKLLNQRSISINTEPATVPHEMKILIIEEVLKVQIEILQALDHPKDRESLMALIHKIKGGALLSEDQILYEQCTLLEQSDQSLAVIQKLFYENLIYSNQHLDKQIEVLKCSLSTSSI